MKGTANRNELAEVKRLLRPLRKMRISEEDPANCGILVDKGFGVSIQWN